MRKNAYFFSQLGCRYAQWALVIAWAVSSAATAVHAADAVQQGLAEAEQRKQEQLANAKEAVAELESQRKEAARKQRPSEVKRLSGEIKKAKDHLTAVSDTSVEEFASQIAEEKKKAIEQRNKAIEERKAAAEKASQELAELQAQRNDEADRLEKSGGCPLKIVGMNFYHATAEAVRLGRRAKLLPDDAFGSSTIVICSVVNRGDAPIEAYELLVEFVNGFDEVISQHALKGTLLEPGEERKSVNSFPEKETAVTLRISVERTKLPDGTLWARKPEHKRVTAVYKQPEGADKVGD